jgi:hypothetical protein
VSGMDAMSCFHLRACGLPHRGNPWGCELSFVNLLGSAVFASYVRRREHDHDAANSVGYVGVCGWELTSIQWAVQVYCTVVVNFSRLQSFCMYGVGLGAWVGGWALYRNMPSNMFCILLDM